jgi:hypothetical protein
VGRIFYYLLRLANFNDPALMHHRYPVRGFSDDPHIVGNQDNTGISIAT